MEKRELTCIGCPMGCAITVTLEKGEIREITGQTCKQGERYARKEVTNPTRIVTSTLRVRGGCMPVVPVKTSMDIPKERIFACMEAMKGLEVAAPIRLGEVLLPRIAGTEADLIATRDVAKGEG